MRRRTLLVSLGGALVASGCKRAAGVPATCPETPQLPEAEHATRAALGYVEHSPDPSKACQACQQWVAATSEGACGGCKLLKGPIHPEGTCKVFTLKA